jgi:hypothetical protein
VNNVIKGKLLESGLLAQRAESNTKEQFNGSPDILIELTNAIMDGQAANIFLTKQGGVPTRCGKLSHTRQMAAHDAIFLHGLPGRLGSQILEA